MGDDGRTRVHSMSEDGSHHALAGTTGARERRSHILRLLGEQEYVDVSALASTFGLTEASVRRDLSALETDGLLTRVRGGAVGRRNALRGHGYQVAIQVRLEEKRRIAAAAAPYLQARDSAFFSSGTTVARVASLVPRSLRSAITIATNSAAVIDEVAEWEGPHLVLLGGLYLPEYRAFVGPQTIATLQHMRADVAVIGCDGLSADGGLTTPHQLVAEVEGAMVGHASRVVAVVDSTKIGRRGFTPIAPISAVHTLVTDTGADPAEVEAIRAAGVEVVLA
jgi:DeoR/GlpR family transcriptional regulator of sugar metabolism